MSDPDLADDPKFRAALEYVWTVLPRPLDIDFRVEGQAPTVWIVVCTYPEGRYAVEADLDHLGALLKLCERITYGSVCLYCGRPAAFDPNMLELSTKGVFCWMQWDPELRVFRRSCEGDA